MTHYSTLIQRCRATNSLLADELSDEFDRIERARLDARSALQNLADAADAVGVRFFDTDTMEPEVEAMQTATKAARAALT